MLTHVIAVKRPGVKATVAAADCPEVLSHFTLDA